MARIKVSNPGLFGTYAQKRTVGPDKAPLDASQRTLQDIQAMRQGVALAKEVGETAIMAGDVIAAGIGKATTPSVEDLKEEAAKKRAAEITAKRSTERTALESRRKAEEARLAELQAGPTLAPTKAIDEATRASQMLQQGLKKVYAGEIAIEDWEKSVARAKQVGAITPDQANRLVEEGRQTKQQLGQVGKEKLAYEMEQYQAGPSTEMARRETGLAVTPETGAAELDKAKQNVASLKNIIENARQLGQDTADLEQQLLTETNRVKALEQYVSRATIVAPEEMAKAEETAKLAGKELYKGRGPVAETYTGVEQIAEVMTPQEAEQNYASIVAKRELDRTPQEKQLLAALKAKYPQLEGERGGEAYAVTEADKETQDFISGAEKRKQEIQADVSLTVEEQKQKIEEINKRIELAKQGKLPFSQQVINKAVAGAAPLYPAEDKTGLEEVRQKAMAVAAEVADPEKVRLLTEQEDIRNNVLKDTMKAMGGAAAEIAMLNQKRQVSGLTREEALRYVQLEKFITDNKAAVERAKGLKATDKEFTGFISELAKRVQNGQLPPPETEQQREARFAEELSKFDKETAATIDEESKKAAQEVAETYVDADTLRFLAVQASLTGDEKLATKILGVMRAGNVVGIAPTSMLDWVTGGHKKRFQNEMFQTLFLRAKGKTSQEMELMQARMLIQAANAESLMRLREQQEKKTRQEFEEKEATFETRKKKLEAETAKKQFDASEEVLAAKMDKLDADAQIGQIKAGSLQRVINSKLALSEAMRKHYLGKNATEIAKAEAGERTEQLRWAMKTYGDAAAAVDSLAKANTVQNKTYDRFQQYFKKDPTTGKVIKTPAYDRDFPTDKAAREARYAELGVTRKDGRLAFQKLLQEAEAFKAAYAGGRVGTPDQRKEQNASYALVSAAIRGLSNRLATKGRLDPNVGPIINDIQAGPFTDLMNLQNDITTEKVKSLSEVKARVDQINANADALMGGTK